MIVNGTAAAVLAIVVAGTAYKLRALTLDGAAVTAVIGFIVYGWGGAGAALPLLLFFSSATLLTKLTDNAESNRGNGRLLDSSGESGRDLAGDAGGRRALQVLANGGIPAAAIIGFAMSSAPYWLAAFAGALAAVTADTWATEIGAFSTRPPVLITTGKRVEPGRSGGVSLAGTLGGMAGALTLAFGAAASFAIWPPLGRGAAPIFLVAVALAGIVGLFADSLFGATVQARFRCPHCKVDTEHPVHRCGAEAQHISGLRLCTNDVVNLFASLIGALGATIVFLVSSP